MLTDPQVQALATAFGTPLWVMDAATIRSRVAQLRAFDTLRYAQKANPNTHLLRLLRAEGVKVDAVSRGEAVRALQAGYQGGAARAPLQQAAEAEIVYTADLLDRESLDFVLAQGLVVNCGSIDMLRQLGERGPGHAPASAGAPQAGRTPSGGGDTEGGTRGHAVWIRLNPGFGHGHSRKTNTGGEGSKHGIWHEQLPEALALIQQTGLRLVGLHMHIGSGVDYQHLAQVGGAMVQAVRQVQAAGLDLQALSAGGGLSIPYRAGEPVVDTAHYFELWDAARREAAALLGHPLRLEIEPGRFLVAEAGCLLAEVRAVKRQGRVDYVLVDAGFNELMRPAMYGAHHGLRLVAHDGRALGPSRPTVVAGPLCESGDVFTQGEGGELRPQALPAAQVGDWLLIEHTGAYGSAMSSNYNSRPLAAEVLLGDGPPRLIRRRQRVEELLALEE